MAPMNRTPDAEEASQKEKRESIDRALGLGLITARYTPSRRQLTSICPQQRKRR